MKANNIINGLLVVSVFALTNYVSKCTGYLKGVKVMGEMYPDLYMKKKEEEKES
jgi:allophanate hydrolase subunit 1